jgi:hypothetical protein
LLFESRFPSPRVTPERVQMSRIPSPVEHTLGVVFGPDVSLAASAWRIYEFLGLLKTTRQSIHPTPISMWSMAHHGHPDLKGSVWAVFKSHQQVRPPLPPFPPPPPSFQRFSVWASFYFPSSPPFCTPRFPFNLPSSPYRLPLSPLWLQLSAHLPRSLVTLAVSC